MCCSDEVSPGAELVRASASGTDVAIEGDHPGGVKDKQAQRPVSSNQAGSPNELMDQDGHQQDGLNTPRRESNEAQGIIGGIPNEDSSLLENSLQRTPPNTWHPSLTAPGAPRKTYSRPGRRGRPTPYDLRVIQHEERQARRVGQPVEVNLDTQPSALMDYFGDRCVRSMISPPAVNAHTFMTEVEQEYTGPEWTWSGEESD